ncbi:MAG: zinc metalloprotease HtpX [Desulfobulbaceae bacterium]|jgi:heat shock protein HtpX|nr:zinc metalloprotease HtpX [Desulfobulbaceae bacterium]
MAMGNTTKTFMFMAAMVALFMVVGQALGGRQGMMAALVMAVAMNFFAYWFSDSLALRMNGAVEIAYQDAPDLYQLISSLASRAGLPMPKVCVVDSDTPNAFATGRDPDHAAVAVTTGLIRLMNRDELAGVIAHELGHIKNRDILISSISATMAGAISYLATMAQWSMLFGGRSQDGEGGGNPLAAIISMIVAPVAASLIQMAISRSREYQADATGAAICGSPRSLAQALGNLENYNRQLPMAVNPASAQMYIVNPLAGGQLASLFSTHPPIQERIQRLLAMGGR